VVRSALWTPDDIIEAKKYSEISFKKGHFVRVKGKDACTFDPVTGCYICPGPYGGPPTGGRRSVEFFFDPRANAFRQKVEFVKYELEGPRHFGKDKLNFSTKAFSITVARKKKDIPNGWFERFKSSFAMKYATKCCIGCERGSQKKNLHLQVIVEMPCSRDATEALKEVKKTIMDSLLISPGDDHQISLRQIDEDDGIKFILGYVQKDRGFQHYERWVFGYTETELEVRRVYFLI
jgi:hypothetical protein